MGFGADKLVLTACNSGRLEWDRYGALVGDGAARGVASQPAAARSATIPHKLGAHKGPTLYPSIVLLLDAALPAHARAADSPAGRS